MRTRIIPILLFSLFVLLAISVPAWAAEEGASTGWKDILWTVAGAAVTALAGTGVGLVVRWLKNLGWVKKLHVDHIIDKAAELAIHYAEQWGKTASKKGAEKLNKAKEAFEAELSRQGVKLDAGAMETRLESIFNKIKEKVEHKELEKPTASATAISG